MSKQYQTISHKKATDDSESLAGESPGESPQKDWDPKAAPEPRDGGTTCKPLQATWLRHVVTAMLAFHKT